MQNRIDINSTVSETECGFVIKQILLNFIVKLLYYYRRDYLGF